MHNMKTIHNRKRYILEAVQSNYGFLERIARLLNRKAEGSPLNLYKKRW